MALSLYNFATDAADIDHNNTAIDKYLKEHEADIDHSINNHNDTMDKYLKEHESNNGHYLNIIHDHNDHSADIGHDTYIDPAVDIGHDVDHGFISDLLHSWWVDSAHGLFV